MTALRRFTRKPGLVRRRHFFVTALFSNNYLKHTLILAIKKIPLYLCTVRTVSELLSELLLHTYVILQSRGMYSLSREREGGKGRIEEKIVVLFEICRW